MVWLILLPLISPSDTVTILIPPGTTIYTISQTLHDSGIIQSPWLFRIWARLTATDRHLQSGLYRFPRPYTIEATLHKLRTGKGELIKLTIPEGLTLHEIATLVESHLYVPRDSFLHYAHDTSFLHSLGIPATTAEGYLFPTTYFLPPFISARHVLKEMIHQFYQHITPDMLNRASQLGFSLHEIVTLASIIEKEAVLKSELPLISSVFHNRLSRGMKLEANPTVEYALGHKKRWLTNKDLQTPSPYNTYLYPGLPPGPICNPSLDAILAALYPADTDYLYFVSRGDGTHIFSKTYTAHKRAVRRLRKFWLR